ncbi:type VI secretion system protein ImpF [Rhizobium sp. RU35A]|uniref:Type VI secretion system baseplate subunit TssE n=1 Tax=Rhizobium straminoryzae TaxID=1387186 RepID=A0A549TFL8_9HYPH|nr:MULTISPECIES: type VI secretion system baseplate subunit TssE [Rhizobium]TRL41324.1 type VI secretion system baseplate subunit TssE [Rhizobium straminoryzae]SIQ49195.1 type VI secretion system protein ImpF [Rhizobium sp. RU35A]
MADPLDIYRAGSRQLVRSVLDRLLDDAPFSPADPPVSDATQVRELREAIRRDLELLLNTRRCVQSPGKGFPELQNSLRTFGVDGVVAANLMTDESKFALARSIERSISRFETRLSNVRVTILKNRSMTARALRMRIEATFRLHEGMPPISFESVIDPSSQRFHVEGADG